MTVRSLTVDGSGVLAAGGSKWRPHVWRSADGGQSWSLQPPPVHGEVFQDGVQIVDVASSASVPAVAIGSGPAVLRLTARWEDVTSDAFPRGGAQPFASAVADSPDVTIAAGGRYTAPAGAGARSTPARSGAAPPAAPGSRRRRAAGLREDHGRGPRHGGFRGGGHRGLRPGGDPRPVGRQPAPTAWCGSPRTARRGAGSAPPTPASRTPTSSTSRTPPRNRRRPSWRSNGSCPGVGAARGRGRDPVARRRRPVQRRVHRRGLGVRRRRLRPHRGHLHRRRVDRRRVAPASAARAPSGSTTCASPRRHGGGRGRVRSAGAFDAAVVRRNPADGAWTVGTVADGSFGGAGNQLAYGCAGAPTGSWWSGPTTPAATPTPASGPRPTATSGPSSTPGPSAVVATSGPARSPRSRGTTRTRPTGAGGRHRHRPRRRRHRPVAGLGRRRHRPAGTGERLGGAGDQTVVSVTVDADGHVSLAGSDYGRVGLWESDRLDR